MLPLLEAYRGLLFYPTLYKGFACSRRCIYTGAALAWPDSMPPDADRQLDYQPLPDHEIEAPQEVVRIDRDNNYSFPGRAPAASMATGVKIVSESKGQMKPGPYRVTQSFER